MRTERELLLLITKRFQEEFNNVEWYSNFDKELLAEIEKVLAQPEQTEQEPLSEEAVGELLMGGFSTHLMDLVRMIEKAQGIGVKQ